MKQLTIRMKADDVAEVLLYDAIGVDPWFGDGISAKMFREQIKAIKAGTINLRINSPGGDVFEAAAMLNVLDQHPARIDVDIDGLAASAGSVVAMGGDSIRVASNGMIMIHDPYGGVMGGADDMRRYAELLDKVKGQILDVYERRVKDRGQLDKWMKAETWFTGQEAVDVGLADEVSGAVPIAAFADLGKVAAKFGFKRTPTPKAPPGPTPEQVAAFEARKAIVAGHRKAV